MSSGGYNFTQIEKKWQAYWDEHKTFKAPGPGDAGFDASKPKYYVLDMFPYPSGEGLHVGHPEGYIATDIVARYRRMRGFNVLHPMGWDAFGLPAEQYARKIGVHPAESTKRNIEYFRRQMKSLGLSHNWDREFSTTDEGYYKWTQWIFLKLYERGLAYEAEVPVWWCEQMGTVLANEEVIAGRSERGDYPCVRRPLRQWMLKITAYAERLLKDLDLVDWPQSIKEMQRNWIGKSEGAEAIFEVADGAARGEKLPVFTTRPDTLFGATYMVVAPEHPLVQKLTTSATKKAVAAYCEEAARKSDMDRTELAQEKTGVFSGSYAWNPVFPDRNDPRAKIPIWIADYVLISYGTGAIMAVPAHDERDFDFAIKYDLPITQVVEPSEPIKGTLHEKQAKGLLREAERGGVMLTCFVGDGAAVNSPVIAGLPTPEAKKRITEWLRERGLGEFKVTYRLRDWIFSRQHYWGEPFPVIHLEEGGTKPVAESDLPVALPYLADFEPQGLLRPLDAAKGWIQTTDPDTGRPARRETNTMPNWAGSCWYYLRFTDPHNDKAAWDKTKEKYWMPVDLYVGGAEHAVLHLLYARFWHKVLYDAGLVSTPEPFQKLFNQGMILGTTYRTKEGRIVPYDRIKFAGDKAVHAETGEPLEGAAEKMSKSRGNVVNPDSVIAEHGADTMRLYEMFMGPLDVVKPWNTQDVPGVHRFLGRVWRLIVTEDGNVRPNLTRDDGSPQLERALHRCIKKVTQDVDVLAMNTAISAMMIFVNEATKSPDQLGRTQAERFVLLLSPFAPHVSEELWQRLGHDRTIAYANWPTWDEKLLREEDIVVPVQINGKLRARLTVPSNSTDDDLTQKALADETVQKMLQGRQARKIIVVSGKLVNIVV